MLGSRSARIALVVGLLLLAAGTGLGAYQYLTRPITLTVAGGSVDGEVVRALSLLAERVASGKTRIRLKVVDTATAIAASQALAKKQVDLAVLRADVGDSSAARSVVLITHLTAMVVVPAGSPIKSFSDLNGKVLGVVDAEVNQRLVELLVKEYGLSRAGFQIKDLTPAEARQAILKKQVSAVLVVAPLTQRYLAALRGLVPPSAKQQPNIIALDSAQALAAVSPQYESFELPKGIFRTSPSIPDDTIDTIRVPLYLAAHKDVPEDLVSELAKTIMNLRQELVSEVPGLVQISAPGADKDPAIQVHPGATAFFQGSQTTFFEKYGDVLFYGMMIFGSLTSLWAGARRFMEFGPPGPTTNPLDDLRALGARIRAAQDDRDLVVIEDEIDQILSRELLRHGNGDAQATETGALSLAASRLEHLINFRRQSLVPAGASQSLV